MALSFHVPGKIKHFDGQGDDGEDFCCSVLHTGLQQMSTFTSLNSKKRGMGEVGGVEFMNLFVE